MKEFMSKLKENKIYSIGIGIVVLLLAALCLVLFMDLGRLVANEPKIIDSKVKVVKEYEKLQDISDLSTRDELLTAIQSGKSDCYIVNDRYFAVLTTGGDSVSDIEYSIETNADSGTTVLWRLSDSVSTESKVRYKLIEFDNEVRVEKKISKIAEGTANGITNIIAIREGDTIKYYGPTVSYLEAKYLKMTEGLYSVTFKDGKVYSYTAIESIYLEDCVIVDKLIGSIYTVQIPTGAIIAIDLGDLNINIGDKHNIQISYSNKFSGKVEY